MTPTVGRIVLYRLKCDDLDRLALDLKKQGRYVNVARGTFEKPAALGPAVMLEWDGNPLHPGDIFPMVVIRPWFQPEHYTQGQSVLNGQALLDGPCNLWTLSVPEGSTEGTWHWPPRA